MLKRLSYKYEELTTIEARFAVKGMGHVQENSFFLLKMSEQK
jgi:hypothetical protein